MEYISHSMRPKIQDLQNKFSTIQTDINNKMDFNKDVTSQITHKFFGNFETFPSSLQNYSFNSQVI